MNIGSDGSQSPRSAKREGPTASRSERVAEGLAFINALPRTERSAFLGLFAGARFPWTSFNGDAPFIGKAECEWVEDWRDFYGNRLVAAGLFHFAEAEPKPALGMVPGSTFIKIECGPTELGWEVREAFWEALNSRLDDGGASRPLAELGDAPRCAPARSEGIAHE